MHNATFSQNTTGQCSSKIFVQNYLAFVDSDNILQLLKQDKTPKDARNNISNWVKWLLFYSHQLIDKTIKQKHGTKNFVPL